MLSESFVNWIVYVYLRYGVSKYAVRHSELDKNIRHTSWDSKRIDRTVRIVGKERGRDKVYLRSSCVSHFWTAVGGEQIREWGIEIIIVTGLIRE